MYDGNLVIQERNANNLPQVTYTRGTDLSGRLEGAGGIGGLLARSDLSTLNPQLSTTFYHSDGNGNITCLINASQAIVAHYLYDPYGNILSQSGLLADANLYRFSSKEYHVASGLVYYLYRFYDPNLQRWPNQDPLGDDGSLTYNGLTSATHLEPRRSGDMAAIIETVNDPLSVFTRVNQNLFGAVGNNPISNIDPLGLDFANCYADCIERYRNPISEQLPNYLLSKLPCSFKLPGWLPFGLGSANALGNLAAGPTGKGIAGYPSHPTTWQHRVGSKFGGFGSRIGRFLGRAAIVLTVADGFFDIGLLGGCAAACAGE